MGLYIFRYYGAFVSGSCSNELSGRKRKEEKTTGDFGQNKKRRDLMLRKTIAIILTFILLEIFPVISSSGATENPFIKLFVSKDRFFRINLPVIYEKKYGKHDFSDEFITIEPLRSGKLPVLCILFVSDQLDVDRILFRLIISCRGKFRIFATASEDGIWIYPHAKTSDEPKKCNGQEFGIFLYNWKKFLESHRQQELRILALSNYGRSEVPTKWGDILVILPPEVPIGAFESIVPDKPLFSIQTNKDIDVYRWRDLIGNCYWILMDSNIPHVYAIVKCSRTNICSFWFYEKGMPVPKTREEFWEWFGWPLSAFKNQPKKETV